jgi:hypothetical protein
MSAKDWRQDYDTVAAAIAALAPGAAVPIADLRILGNNSGAPAVAFALTAAQVRTVLALAAIATSGSGADLGAGTVTLGKIANQADLTILGNNTGGAAAPLALTAAQVRTVLALAAIATSGSGADLAAGTVTDTKVSDDFARSYATAVINFKNNTTGNACIPVRTGFYFIAQSFSVVFLTGTGTATGNMTVSAGNDAGETNILGPSTISTAAVNNSIGLVPHNISVAATTPTTAHANGSAAGTVKITAPTGVTTLTGQIIATGRWIPV